MANIYQQAAARRKIAYLVSIGVLLFGTMVVRGTIVIPAPGLRELSEEYSVEGRARRHELNELSQGDAELASSAVQLLLTGSRGLAVSALWNNAIEKQRRQEWNELDISVKSITKLQPHFTAPWLFQSWNITYNVSVEMDRLNDMYFYIARGISIIGEGESMNRNNPDLRYNLGFYYQNKFGVSDKVTTLRCLYQLSCIPDEDRDPERLLNPDKTINTARFEEFCKNNPQLIRRLKTIRVSPDGSEERARPLVDRPEGIVSFLRNNKTIPSRYKKGTREINDRLKQFPVLPDLRDNQSLSSELQFSTELADYQSDAFLASRAWYALANTSVPPPNPLPTGELGDFDRFKYRVPKRPTLMVFRQGPVRAQSYFAERLTKEAWFDKDPYELDDIENDQVIWVKKTDENGKPVSLQLTTQVVAQDAWKDAAVRWRKHGRDNGLYLEPKTLARHNALAEDYVRAHPGKVVGQMPDPLTAEEANDEKLKERHLAMYVMNGYSAYRNVTNYETFDIEADAMATDEAMYALKKFHQAERANREELRLDKAAALYEDAFTAWKKVLNRQECRNRTGTESLSPYFQQCRDVRDIERYQEEMYEKNLRYLRISQELHLAERRRATLVLLDMLDHASIATGGNPFKPVSDLNVLFDRTPILKSVMPLPIPGPLDGESEDGKPWITDVVKMRIKEKLGLIKPTPKMPPTDPSMPPGMQP